MYNIPGNETLTQLSTLLCLCKMLQDNPCPEPDLQMALKKKKKKSPSQLTATKQSIFPTTQKGGGEKKIIKITISQFRGLGCNNKQTPFGASSAAHRTATIYTKAAKYYNEHKAWAFESPVLEAEIVIKLRREMDAKIGLDTNYQKERHLCKFTRSLNFSSTET